MSSATAEPSLTGGGPIYEDLTQRYAADGSEFSPSTRQIRGSALLFVGRLLSLALGFVAQVVTIRYLAKEDFGAFAYALSVVSLTSSAAAFGLDKSMSRLLPLYQEAADARKLLGALTLAIGTMVFIGMALVAGVYWGRDFLGQLADPAAIAVLLILVWLTPIQALDPLFSATLAVLARPRAIFFRRYVLQPLMLLAVLVVVVVADGGLVALAVGYVITGIAGLVVYGAVLMTLLRRAGYLDASVVRAVTVPWREVFSYSLPLLPSDLVFLIRTEFVVLLLQALRSTLDVADFRAVFPLARLNLVVLQSFTLLYVPNAARLHHREDHEALEDLRWHSSAWVALISFPVFAASFSLAAPVVTLFYGPRYSGAALVLAIVSLGFYLSALLGFGGLTLRAIGRVRFLLAADAVAALASVGLYLLLIPSAGAVGAAVATAATLALQGAVYQLGLRRSTATSEAARYYVVCFVLAGAALGLLAIQIVAAPPLWVGLILVALTWLSVMRSFRRSLAVAQTFPEIRRIPIVGGFLAGEFEQGSAVRANQDADEVIDDRPTRN